MKSFEDVLCALAVHLEHGVITKELAIQLLHKKADVQQKPKQPAVQQQPAPATPNDNTDGAATHAE